MELSIPHYHCNCGGRGVVDLALSQANSHLQVSSWVADSHLLGYHLFYSVHMGVALDAPWIFVRMRVFVTQYT